jgi:hypothetical protein
MYVKGYWDDPEDLSPDKAAIARQRKPSALGRNRMPERRRN